MPKSSNHNIKDLFLSSRRLLFSIFLLLPFWVIAQDSLNIKTVFTSIEVEMEYPDSFRSIDTHLNLIHQYDMSTRLGAFGVNTGNIGSPFRKLYFEMNEKPGFNTGLNHFNYYLYQAEKARYFDTYTPYFDFYYTQGPTELQFFKALHSRNINPFWNVTVDYRATNSEGVYENQNSKVGNLNLTSRYKTPNDRYHAFFSFVNNRFFVFENGGLINEEEFWNLNPLNRPGGSMQLENVQQEFYTQDYRLTHFLSFNKEKPDLDTGITRKDSLVRFQMKKGLRLYHQVYYHKEKYHYMDPNPLATYYGNFYLDTFNTNDSLHHFEVGNQLGFEYRNSKSLFLKAGVSYKSGRVLKPYDSSYQNMHVTGCFKNKLGPGELELKADLIAAGTHAGNYFFKEEYTLFPDSQRSLVFGASQLSNGPQLIQSKIIANHLSWDLEMKDSRVFNFNTRLNWKNIGSILKADLYLLDHYIFFDKNRQPEQLTNTFYYFRLGFENHLKSKHFHSITSLIYQFSNEKEVLQYPEVMLDNSSFYDGMLFKEKLRIQVGIDTRLRQSYYPADYFAPYGIFFQQEDEQALLYPYMNVFASILVKRMRIFVKYENFAAFISDTRSILFPAYPYNPPVFRLGFTWMFYD